MANIKLHIDNLQLQIQKNSNQYFERAYLGYQKYGLGALVLEIDMSKDAWPLEDKGYRAFKNFNQRLLSTFREECTQYDFENQFSIMFAFIGTPDQDCAVILRTFKIFRQQEYSEQIRINMNNLSRIDADSHGNVVFKTTNNKMMEVNDGKMEITNRSCVTCRCQDVLKLQRCSKYKLVWYCSRECQLKDYQKHKQFC